MSFASLRHASQQLAVGHGFPATSALAAVGSSSGSFRQQSIASAQLQPQQQQQQQQQLLECPMCTHKRNLFVGRANLEKHLALVHYKYQPYECTECCGEIRFHKEALLRDHYREEHGMAEFEIIYEPTELELFHLEKMTKQVRLAMADAREVANDSTNFSVVFSRTRECIAIKHEVAVFQQQQQQEEMEEEEDGLLDGGTSSLLAGPPSSHHHRGQQQQGRLRQQQWQQQPLRRLTASSATTNSAVRLVARQSSTQPREWQNFRSELFANMSHGEGDHEFVRRTAPPPPPPPPRGQSRGSNHSRRGVGGGSGGRGNVPMVSTVGGAVGLPSPSVSGGGSSNGVGSQQVVISVGGVAGGGDHIHTSTLPLHNIKQEALMEEGGGMLAEAEMMDQQQEDDLVGSSSSTIQMMQQLQQPDHHLDNHEGDDYQPPARRERIQILQAANPSQLQQAKTAFAKQVPNHVSTNKSRKAFPETGLLQGMTAPTVAVVATSGVGGVHGDVNWRASNNAFRMDCKQCGKRIHGHSSACAHVNSCYMKLSTYACLICGLEIKGGYASYLNAHLRKEHGNVVTPSGRHEATAGHLKQFIRKLTVNLRMISQEVNGQQAQLPPSHITQQQPQKYASSAVGMQKKKVYPKQQKKVAVAAVGAKQYACKECGEAVGSKEKGRHHVNNRHLKLAQWECKVCSKKFYDPSNYKILRHLSTVHKKEVGVCIGPGRLKTYARVLEVNKVKLDVKVPSYLRLTA